MRKTASRYIRGIRSIALLLALSVVASCGTQGSGDTNQLTLTGSTSITPFAEQLAERYQQQHPGQKVNVQGLGSSAGIQAAENGTAEIGMSSRDLQPEEASLLKPIEIARDALAVLVNPNNAINGLS